MSQSAKVTSIDTLDAFRANLIVYMAKATRALDDVSEDVGRTKIWLQTDRVLHWKKELRLRCRALDQAQAELMTERLADNREAIQARKIAVRKAKQRVEYAEEKMARVKYWLRHYESAVEAKTKVVHQMRHVLDYDLKKALAYLDGASKALLEYAEIKPVADGSSAAKSANPSESEIGPSDENKTVGGGS